MRNTTHQRHRQARLDLTVDPAFRGPEVPGYVKVTNALESVTGTEARQEAAEYLDVPIQDVIGIMFTPEGHSALQLWAIYVRKVHAGRLEARRLLDYVKGQG